MGNFDLNNMDGMVFDVLREVGNIGAGNAATSLAQLLQSKVDMMVPKVELLDFKDVGAAMGGEEQIMAGIYLSVSGDIAGSIMFLLDERSAHVLVSKLMMSEMVENKEFDEIEISALKEIGNIITGSYLSALAGLTNMKIDESIPDLCIDMAAAILSVPAIEFGVVSDKILMIQTAFTDDVELNGYFILVPTLDSYEKLLRSLGII